MLYALKYGTFLIFIRYVNIPIKGCQSKGLFVPFLVNIKRFFKVA
jgi:hypothetical protein